MATYNWTGVTGDWTEATDWLPNGVPTSVDDATILAGGAYTVGIDVAEQVAAASLDLSAADATLEIDGTLAVGGGFAVEAGTVLLTGTLADATVSNAGGTFDYGYGTFSNVTFNGTLDLGDSGALLIANGLTVNDATGTLPGVIDITGAGSAVLAVTDSETLDHVTINVGSDIGFDSFNANGDTLELGAGVVLNSVGVNGLQLGGAAQVTSYGTINLGVAGGQASITVAGFANAGALNVTNGQTLTVGSATFGNTGAIVIDAASEVDFQAVAVDPAVSGSIDIEGTLNANGATIDLAAVAITLGGTLANSVLVSDGGLINYAYGTLSNTTVLGTLDLGDSGALLIANGLTVNDATGTLPGVIDITGAGSAVLAVTDSETLDHVTINVGSDIGFDSFNANGDTLELGAGVVLNSVGVNGLQLGGAAQVTSYGTINLGVAGGQASITVAGFANAGALNVTNGQTLTVGSATFGNTGAIVIDAASEVDFQAVAVDPAVSGSIDIEGTLNANGATIDLAAVAITLGGTLANSVLVSDGGLINYAYGTLSNTTVLGTLDLGDSGALLIANGLTVNDATGTLPGVIDITGAGSAVLAVTDSETLDHVTINVGSDIGFDTLNGNGDTLTFGAGAVVNSVGIHGLQIGGVAALTNFGHINAGVVGGVGSIDIGSFTNAGTIAVSNGQILSVSSEDGTLVNTGLMSVASGGSLDVTSAVGGAGTMTVGVRSTLELRGAVAATQNVWFVGTLSTVVLADPMHVAAKFHGFASSDHVDLITYSPFDKVATVGAKAVITDASGTATLDFTKIGPNQAFGLLYDGTTGADLIVGTIIKGSLGGHSTLNGGAHTSIITAYGYGNTISALTCDAVIKAGSGSATVRIGSDSAAVTLSGSGNRVTAGNGHNLIRGYASTSSIVLGAGNNIVSLIGSDDIVVVGGGANTISLTGSRIGLKLGTGFNHATVTGSSDVVVIGRGGSDVTMAGSHDAVFLGTSSSTVHDLTTRLDVVVGGNAGHSIITGVASDPRFVLDLIDGVGGYHTAAQAYAALQSDGNGGSLLALGNTGAVDFAGVAPAQLSAHNFNVVHTYHFA